MSPCISCDLGDAPWFGSEGLGVGFGSRWFRGDGRPAGCFPREKGRRATRRDTEKGWGKLTLHERLFSKLLALRERGIRGETNRPLPERGLPMTRGALTIW